VECAGASDLALCGVSVKSCCEPLPPPHASCCSLRLPGVPDAQASPSDGQASPTRRPLPPTASCLSLILVRFARNEFSLGSKAIIGVEFQTYTFVIDHRSVKVHIWDTADQERY
jgi:hypothetical protein